LLLYGSSDLVKVRGNPNNIAHRPSGGPQNLNGFSYGIYILFKGNINAIDIFLCVWKFKNIGIQIDIRTSRLFEPLSFG